MGRQFKITEQPSRHVLRPFDVREVVDISRAARIAGYSTAHMRRLVAKYDLGRRIDERTWKVSRIALAMFLEADAVALRRYHDGDRSSPEVVEYYRRLGIPIPGKAAAHLRLV